MPKRETDVRRCSVPNHMVSHFTVFDRTLSPFDLKIKRTPPQIPEDNAELVLTSKVKT